MNVVKKRLLNEHTQKQTGLAAYFRVVTSIRQFSPMV